MCFMLNQQLQNGRITRRRRKTKADVEVATKGGDKTTISGALRGFFP